MKSKPDKGKFGFFSKSFYFIHIFYLKNKFFPCTTVFKHIVLYEEVDEVRKLPFTALGEMHTTIYLPFPKVSYIIKITQTKFVVIGLKYIKKTFNRNIFKTLKIKKHLKIWE